MKKILLAVSMLAFGLNASAATNETSFTPYKIETQIFSIKLRNNASGAQTTIRQCTGTCNFDLAKKDPSQFASQFTTVTPANGTYDQVVVNYCSTGSTYTVKIAGGGEINHVPYYTAGNTNILSTNLSDLADVILTFGGGCEVRHALAAPLTITTGTIPNFKPFTLPNFSAWLKLGPAYRTTTQGCIGSSTESVCINGPDLFPVVFTGPDAPVDAEVFAFAPGSNGFTSVSGLLGLFKNRTTGAYITGFTRIYFSENSQPLSPRITFGTSLKTFGLGFSGTYGLSNYPSPGNTGRSLATFLAFNPNPPNQVLTGSFVNDQVQSVPYTAYKLNQPSPAVSYQLPEFGHCINEVLLPTPHTFPSGFVSNDTNVWAITPLGTLAGNGEVKGRHYLNAKTMIVNTLPTPVHSPLRTTLTAPIAGQMVSIRHVIRQTADGPDEYYTVGYKPWCNTKIFYDHLRYPGAKVQAAALGRPIDNLQGGGGGVFPPAVPIYFTAGEPIGESDGAPPQPVQSGVPARVFTFDVGVVSTLGPAAQFNNQARYLNEPRLTDFVYSQCALNYLTGPHRNVFVNKMGLPIPVPSPPPFDITQTSDCRNASRDIVGSNSLSGTWFRQGYAIGATGFRLSIGSEIPNEVRLVVDENDTFVFSKATTGTLNLDPALANGLNVEYCYEALGGLQGPQSFKFKITDQGATPAGQKMQKTAAFSGDCSQHTNPVFSENWER